MPVLKKSGIFFGTLFGNTEKVATFATLSRLTGQEAAWRAEERAEKKFLKNFRKRFGSKQKVFTFAARFGNGAVH